MSNEIKNISDIENCFYINLKHRVDRKMRVEKELATIGIKNPTRFNAVKLDNGAVGCSMSHLKCIQIAKENDFSHVLVCEDDIQFLDPNVFKKQINNFLMKHDNWDVILLAGNNTPPYINVDDCCIRVLQCQTTTGYIVKQHYYDTLIENYKKGIHQLIREPYNHKIYAIDKYWFQLQKKDKWFLITPLTVVQREDYSDIEKRHTNYSRVLLDIDKKHFFKPT